MKRFNLLVTLILLGIIVNACSSSYLGQVDIVGVGAGEKPTTQDKYYIDPDQIDHIVLTYTPGLKSKEQEVSKGVKFVAGEALVKNFSGQPQLMVDYLNFHQKFDNLVLVLDKNGVVAWEGHLKFLDFGNAYGVSKYGLTGPKRIHFGEAMETYVGKEKKAKKYKKDKKIKFPKNNKESFAQGFSYAKKYPFLFTKLPEMEFTTIDGELVRLSQYTENKKPTVLVFYMAQGKKERDLGDAVQLATDVGKVLRGGEASHKVSRPQVLLKKIENVYLK